MATIVKGVTRISFCTECHKIHIVGKWQNITKKIDFDLRKHSGEWKEDMVICQDCQKVTHENA